MAETGGNAGACDYLYYFAGNVVGAASPGASLYALLMHLTPLNVNAADLVLYRLKLSL